MKNNALRGFRPDGWQTVAMALTLMSGTAIAGEAQGDGRPGTPDGWQFRLTPQFTYLPYHGETTRDESTNYGVTFDAERPERYGVTLALSHMRLDMRSGLPALDQDTGFASGRVHFTSSWFPGRMTVRLDGYSVSSNDATHETDDVDTIALQLAHLNTSRSLYVDLGYAASGYGDSRIGNGDLTVQQWTPTLGFALNDGADWMQARLYDVRVSNARRAMQHSGTDAVELKWTHYFPSGNDWLPGSTQLGGLLGQRIYGVDWDTAVLFNLADTQQGGVMAGAQWRLGSNLDWLLSAGVDRYTTQVTGPTTHYTANHLFTGVTLRW
ncbi:MAG: hypothetical protein HQL99_07285 [Magnetococcales bacterium]|nr:hypothetical protein [Magnetococcales bacterium]